MNWAILPSGTTAHRFTVRGGVYDAMCGRVEGAFTVNHPGDVEHCAACENLDDVPGLGRSFAQAFMPGAMAFMVRK